MSDFTPGPWQLDDDPEYSHYQIVAAENGQPRSVAMTPKAGAGKANARLIAAAPDLLDGLRALVREVEAVNEGESLIDALEGARAALAQALGEEVAR